MSQPIAPHEIALFEQRTPSSETGVYSFKHKHDWAEIGVERWPVGTWHPLFRCLVCTDVLCDLAVEVPAPSSAVGQGAEPEPTS